MQEFLDYLIGLAKTHGPDLILAIVTLVVGLWIIRIITRAVSRLMKKRNVDPSLQPFFRSLLNVGLKAMLVVSVLSMVGVAVTSFVAILGAAGLAVGLALSGTLQNFAGGVVILILKPFKVGDYIEAAGHSGSVKEIQIFHTILTTPDNIRIILPNGPVSTGAVKNYTAEDLRRVDITFGIGYGDDIDKARAIIRDILEKDGRILSEPAEPFIGLKEMADSSINLVMRAWAKREDYWNIYFAVMEEVKKRFDAEGIEIPFPQRDVHLHQVSAN